MLLVKSCLRKILIHMNMYVYIFRFQSLSKADKGDSIITMKLMSCIPMFTIQMFIVCNLCEKINEKVIIIIFFYS